MKKIGLQLYTVREHMNTEEDVDLSFKKIKAAGYDEIQTAGCKIPYEKFSALAKENNLEIVGTHESFKDLLNDPDAAMENHRILGTVNIGIGSMPKKYRESEKDLFKFIDLANGFAEKINKYGFKFTYHNHCFEFQKYNNVSMMETLAKELNPKTTSFVLDTYWVQHGGGDVRYWIEKLSGRIDILHLKDMVIVGGEPQITEIGNGNLNFQGVIKTAKSCGVKHFIVEQDICLGDPFASIQISSDFLHS